jgi:Lipocalin-like domain
VGLETMVRYFVTQILAILVSLASPTAFAQGGVSGAPIGSREMPPPTQMGTAAIDAAAFFGSWRLVRIDYSGPSGPLVDPFFGPEPAGIVMYQANGWMSVQIVTGNRPRLPRSAVRTAGDNSAEEASLKAAALDSYYAYFGRWEYSASARTIVHHVTASVLPYETGIDLTREVQLDGKRLNLIVRGQQAGQPRTRVLVWERIEEPPR